MASDSEAAAMSVEFSEFLADENTNPEERLALRAFLKARPKYSKPTDYISDIEQRVQLLREIQQKCEKRVIDIDSTAALWSALMVVPLERLRFYRDFETRPLIGVLNIIAMNMPILLKVFLTKNLSQEELLLARTSKKRTHSSVNSKASSSIVDKLDLDINDRNKKESQKCLQRDEYCVVTGAANPDICHIFPFAAKKNPDRISSGLSIYLFLWDNEISERLKGLLVGDENIIDTARNMVALQPLLHRWWGKAIFGFEPIEKIEKGIRLRVRWLPRTTLVMKEKVPLDLNPRECLQPHSDSDSHITISHAMTYRPIIDGTVIDITATDSSTVPSWDLFSLQWDLIRMASLCGVAEAINDDDWESDDDDDDDEALQAKVATPGLHPLRSLPVQSQESSLKPKESSPTKSRESSPTKSREPSPTKSSMSQESSLKPRESSTMSRESSPAKSRGGRVDENKRW